MIILTLTAREIRNTYMIPNVQISRATNVWYEEIIIRDDGIEMNRPKQGIAINKNIFDNLMFEIGGIYVVETLEKNNEDRNFVKLIYVQVVDETEVDYIVEGGISQWHLFVTESNMELNEGDEVFVIN